MEEPRDGPLNDAYPGTRWFRLLEVVKAWAYNHAREYSKRDRFHAALVGYAEGRAQEMPDLRGFWDERNNYPAKAAYYIEDHAWKTWRPVQSNNWRWHGDGNFNLEGRDAALVALRSQGVSQEAIGEFHGISTRQVSRRLGGGDAQPRVIGCPVSVSPLVVSCQGCGTVFSAARTSARYCGEGCKQRAKRARKGERDDA